MSDYRRLYIRGGTYFFTVVTHRRRPLFRDPANVAMLREAFEYVRIRRSFDLTAMAVLPDHLHCIWRLDEADTDFSTRWQMIKTHFTRKLPRTSKPVWQPRFWEHTIRGEADLHRHLDYIHYNPVKHGYTKAATDWPWTSFGKFVRKGWYENDWGASTDVRALEFE